MRTSRAQCLSKCFPDRLGLIDQQLTLSPPLSENVTLLYPTAIDMDDLVDKIYLAYGSSLMLVLSLRGPIAFHQGAPIPISAFMSIVAERKDEMSMNAVPPLGQLQRALRTAQHFASRSGLGHVPLWHAEISLDPESLVKLTWNDHASNIGPITLKVGAESPSVWAHRGQTIPEEAARLIVLSWCPAPMSPTVEENRP